MIIILHAVIGIIAFIGAGMLATSFAGQIDQLTALQKWSLIVTVSAIGITAVLGLYKTTGGPVALICLILLGFFEFMCFFKKPRHHEAK